ncbi:bacterial bifunctional deaminase-reductase [Dissoconium aciculare CBS 342.82]|uniref:2,5-diamino-6-ribosylamino-4(3H)-pyrimidinone 5'-phosphate reductase n=1 Tax=Dissoconium aciculare CBS 342.82 TaxID=1314786 RepID=A0A6J3MBJ8_9PEZI|nr:bacterial bifunctional deaminase-reductase [Dissoconium aciculare CBS 342.82]KAF1825248.1 bacterial bifunctional deaminase-reductase [Dissoconium aciculare CBS 342.82]
MSDISPLSEDDLAFLASYLPPSAQRVTKTQESDGTTSTIKEGEIPFVTLTYASSLDSMIALAPGARTTLSGPETKSMTHYLRLHHDAILVGAGTAVVDDPGLNCRYPGATLQTQPQPVIVDPRCRFEVSSSAKVCQLAADGKGKAPWIVCVEDNGKPENDLARNISIKTDMAALQSSSDSQQISMQWLDILRALKAEGMNSVMIEGGATIINALLLLPNVVDAVIVTIAPTWLGRGGVNVSPAAQSRGGESTNAAWLRQTSWRQFGNDVVLCGRLGDRDTTT